jgi:hypothetical protein
VNEVSDVRIYDVHGIYFSFLIYEFCYIVCGTVHSIKYRPDWCIFCVVLALHANMAWLGSSSNISICVLYL